MPRAHQVLVLFIAGALTLGMSLLWWWAPAVAVAHVVAPSSTMAERERRNDEAPPAEDSSSEEEREEDEEGTAHPVRTLDAVVLAKRGAGCIQPVSEHDAEPRTLPEPPTPPPRA